MKKIFLPKSTVGIALATLWLAGNYGAPLAIAQAQPAPPAPAAADAAAVPSPDVPPPPSISPDSPLAQVIKLVQAGVDQSVILSYITNSTSTFNLDSEKIIYLSDLGAPNEVVTAMMERDQVLQQQMAASTPPPPPDTTTTEAPETPAPPPPESAPATVNYFYTSLAPYGTWVNVGGYGRCWRPTTVVYHSGWQPYCNNGHWVYTDCGWYWVSDYSWGVTFHYGRWFCDPHWGWCWWPDTVWGPSWVTWRYSNNYCGWAPLPPFTVYQPGVGMFYRGSSVSVGFSFGLSAKYYTFVPTQHFCDPHPWHYRVGAQEAPSIYHQTTVINNFNFNSHNRVVVNNGIGVQHITQATRAPIHPVPVQQLMASSGRPWPGGQIHPPDRRPGVAPQNASGPSPFQHPAQNQNRPVNPTSPAPGHPATGAPPQNHFPQPDYNQNLTPNQNMPAPAPSAQAPWRNYDDKHVASPRGQQFEQEVPRSSPPASVPTERQQSHNDSRPNNPESSSRNAAHSAPAASSAPRSSQPSESSNRSGNQDQNQNGRGH